MFKHKKPVFIESLFASAIVCLLILGACSESEPGQVIVPDVMGLSMGAASTAIQKAGLTIDTPSLQYSDTEGTDKIINQTPKAGELVPAATPVSLVVLLGKEKMPDFPKPGPPKQ